MDFAKIQKQLPLNEIDKILSFLADLLDQQTDMKESCNPIFWEKVKEAWQSLSRKSPTIYLIFPAKHSLND